MYRALFPALLASLAIGLSGLPAASATADVQPAEQLYRDGKYKESIAILTAYLKDHPTDTTALVDRGDDYEALDQQGAAIADYTAALAINPDYAYALASRCESYRETDQAQSALTDCNAAIKLDPRLAYAYRERALLELVGGDSKSALADANQAIQISPNMPFGYGIRCRIYVDMQSYANAIADCNHGLALDPNLELALFQRGRAEVGLEQWPAAIADFNKVLSLDASQSGAFYWLATAYFHTGAYTMALNDVDQYVKEEVDDGDGHLLRAQIEAKLGNSAEARASAATALKHYRIDNDNDGAAKVQQFLDSLGAAASPSPSPP